MSKRHLLTTLGGIAATLAAFLPLSSASAWGPERTTYTMEQPADYAVFNSITNNSAIGDERNFVRIREANSGNPFRDEVEVVPGKEYEVYIYFHNDAGSDTNATGYGMATNVRLVSAYPPTVNTNERGMVSGILSWSYVTPEQPDNPQIGKVWDEAYVTSKTDGVVLRYKTGTATIHNAGAANGSVLPSSLFTEEGALLGYNKLAGTIPGCDEYSGHVTYTLVAENTGTELSKQVSTDGENWSENVKVKPGDYVTYKVQFRNTGNTNLSNVIFKDTHDDGLSLRIGSITVFDYNNTSGKQIDDILDISGYNVGTVEHGDLVQIIYAAQVADGTDYCGKTLKNIINVRFNTDGSAEDDATVTVDCGEKKTDCEETPDAPECKFPETGPVEIVMAIAIALGIGGGGYYFYRTKKSLATVEASAKGEEKAANSGKETAEKKAPEEPKDNTPAEK